MMQGFRAWKASIGLGAVVTLVALIPFHHATMRVAAASVGTPKANTFEIVGVTGASAQQMFLGSEKYVYIVDKTENNKPKMHGRPVWATEYNLDDNTYRAMNITTNSFCAGGNSLANGAWINVGGNQAVDKKGKSTGSKEGAYHEESGGRTVRILERQPDGSAEWVEHEHEMPIDRWYSYVEIMGDGTAMIIGGEMWGGFVDSAKEKQNVSTFEFWPSRGPAQFSPFLAQNRPANLYPLSYLLPDGRVFMQTDWKTQILNLTTGNELSLPDVPFAQRTYPASAATTILPLTPANNYSVKILFCGGLNPKRDDWDVTKWRISETPTSNSCVSISPGDDAHPEWVKEDNLPENRGMGNFIILPTGKLLLLNGVGRGSAGYGNLPWAIGQSFAQDPVVRPVIYDPSAAPGSRFTNAGLPSSTIPRMYHSSATLLPDGAVLIAGSNPNGDVTTEENNSSVQFKTEYRAEKYYPSWYDSVRPKASVIPSKLSYGGDLFQFDLPASTFTDATGPDSIRVTLVRTGFSTHGMNMGMKCLELRSTYTVHADNSVTVNVAQLPPNPNLFQPGPALFFVVVNEVPSIGRLVIVGNGKLGKQAVAEDTVLPANSGKLSLPNSGAGAGSSMTNMTMPTSSASQNLLTTSATTISLQGLIVVLGAWLLA